MKSGHDYNNYLRQVTTHFVFMITERDCELHKLNCPDVLKDRAAKAKERATKDGTLLTTCNQYRPLWEAGI